MVHMEPVQVRELALRGLRQRGGGVGRRYPGQMYHKMEMALVAHMIHRQQHVRTGDSGRPRS